MFWRVGPSIFWRVLLYNGYLVVHHVMVDGNLSSGVWYFKFWLEVPNIVGHGAFCYNGWYHKLWEVVPCDMEGGAKCILVMESLEGEVLCLIIDSKHVYFSHIDLICNLFMKSLFGGHFV